ncbi:MAG: prolyl oligopeptidase family serine peptidase [Myxococcales bacterium]|nr:prolyl oligopeptidase family serine peptidase [Myxococcales bacterium]
MDSSEDLVVSGNGDASSDSGSDLAADWVNLAAETLEVAGPDVSRDLELTLVDVSEHGEEADGRDQVRCAVAPDSVACAYVTSSVHLDDFAQSREVLYQVPGGSVPAQGWPTVLLYQGTGISPEEGWSADFDAPYGLYYQAQLTAELLEAGYAVVAPAHRSELTPYWQTNIAPWNVAWSSSEDHALIEALLDVFESGTWFRADTANLFATGLSSGGYMTSRMAVSYPTRFRALAIGAGSYATCSGSLCAVPSDLPPDHPPTLFVHAADDLVVPLWTATLYRDALEDADVETRMAVTESGGHGWTSDAPSEVLGWFEDYRVP